MVSICIQHGGFGDTLFTKGFREEASADFLTLISSLGLLTELNLQSLVSNDGMRMAKTGFRGVSGIMCRFEN